jgi:hypothetical protein
MAGRSVHSLSMRCCRDAQLTAPSAGPERASTGVTRLRTPVTCCSRAGNRSFAVVKRFSRRPVRFCRPAKRLRRVENRSTGAATWFSPPCHTTAHWCGALLWPSEATSPSCETTSPSCEALLCASKRLRTSAKSLCSARERLHTRREGLPSRSKALLCASKRLRTPAKSLCSSREALFTTG